MATRVMLAVAVLLLGAVSAKSDINSTVSRMIAEVDAMEAAHRSLWGYYDAPATLDKAFVEGGVGFSRRYADAWGGWMYLDFDRVDDLFHTAERRLRDWRGAVAYDGYPEPQVTAMLEQGMTRLRDLDARMYVWFHDDIANNVERARWLDRANAAECCGPTYQYFMEKSKGTYADSISPDYTMVGQISVIPAVPEAGGVPTSGALIAPARLQSMADAAIASGDPARVRRALQTALALTAGSNDPQTRDLVRALTILADRMRFAEEPVDGLLQQAAALPDGPLRDALLARAEAGLLDRVGHLAPLLAEGAGSDPAARESARTELLQHAKRLAQLWDDAHFKFEEPGAAARFFSGLSAASQALDMAQSGDPKARDMADMLNNIGDSFRTPISPVAPFSGPMGAVSAQLDRTRSAWDKVTEALGGVRDAIGGDLSGLKRAEGAAQAVKQILDPRAYARDMTDGFVSGVVNNVPFARSIYEWATG